MVETSGIPLALGDFAAFFGALWGEPGVEHPAPFPWQSELVEHLEREQAWPSLVDLPTGTGKTSLLEIAVFLQALDAARPPAERWMPRRVVLVVDRRVVVDQAHARGGQIVGRLVTAEEGSVLARVADRLRSTFGGSQDDPPLVTSVLRGGIVRDETWAERPDRPALLSSTVDQVGSRMLFRGYGVSSSMRPVHAGLLTNHCLILLDEVHLARPFAQTLAAIGYHCERGAGSQAGGAGLQVVEMTATPTRVLTGTRFPSAPLDPGSHPVLARRLTAAKPVRLAEVSLPTHAAKADRLFAEACVEAAHRLLDVETARTVGVIVNRVSTARAIASRLRDRFAVLDGAAPTDVLLLTGRMRPIDRDLALTEFAERLQTGRTARPERRLVLVATQCVEAGADFDLDAIVTECASLDALRQRFGRVDRDGRRSAAGEELESVIVARGPVATDDPVYGGALARTWAWLQELQRPIDFGIRSLPRLDDAQLSALLPPPRAAPVLLPAHLDAWVQTNPAPALEPEVSRWLHGIQEPDADVHIVWRKDLRGDLLHQPLNANVAADVLERDRRLRDEVAAERVAACPPAAAEALSVPISAARRWLLRQDPLVLADIEGMAPGEVDDAGATRVRRAIRWTESAAEVIEPRQMRPGDVLVVPSDYGGVELRSWAPEGTEHVSDIASAAVRAQRGLVVLRLDPALTPWAGETAALSPTAWEEASGPERSEMVDELLRGLAPSAPDDVRDVGDLRAAEARVRTVRFLHGYPPDRRSAEGAVTPAAIVLTAPARTSADPARQRSSPPLGVGADLDALSFGGRQDLLRTHLDGVRRWVEHFGEALAVESALRGDLTLAASLHDIGKADRRFQSWLHGGDEIARAGAPELLAKSSTASYDRATREAERRLSGYPRGARHELTSIALMLSEPESIAGAHDSDLVLHLVASHHGYCRPFAPLGTDPEPVVVEYARDGLGWSASSRHDLERIDSGVSDRFWTLVDRYGWFGLAWLETLLRLADHRRSGQEQSP